MRRPLLLLTLLAALAVPAAALAAGAATDGTLAVRNGVGASGEVAVGLNVTGAVIGQVDAGRIVIDDLSPDDGVAPVVTGAERRRDLVSGATLYSGTDIRFRALAGHYRIRISGRGIDVNVVGQGMARLAGSPLATSDGRYSLNGGPWLSLPDLGDTVRIGG